MIKKYHPYHIVTLSPWPIIGALIAWNLTIITLTGFLYKINYIFFLINAFLSLTAYIWWKDVTRESAYQGFHQYIVENGLKIGIILFISSEVLFFTSFFWAYFHSRVSPNLEIGQIWPPHSINPFNPINVPLLNTIILIRSGVSVTWAHHSILLNHKKESLFSLLLTCVLGVYFTALQAIEYSQAEFNISDSSYGSCFFIATGFHGIHVLIGTTFLFICLIRLSQINNTFSHIIGFEIAAWYWHFVDIVWLFLYISIYWWGK